ncbi:response regulator [Cohnella silvisoli]|uniref:Response regulator n=1 Tax=Cohnella silvisoli TaxID=2873699 RepID=A0ABV1L485_9BACL|nr:response regulator [Cohnella silvisoli]MCD9026414.1 response regulator [Cohnella silvisoli]
MKHESRKLLIVDDEQSVRDFVISIPGWTRLGFSIVEQAGNGTEALENIIRTGHAPEVMVTDIRMPHMDGIRLAEQVRRDYPQTHIIFLTAHSEFEYAKQAVKLGVSDFITKPFTEEELVDSVRCIRSLGLEPSNSAQTRKEEWLQLVLDPEIAQDDKRERLTGSEVPEGKLIVLSVEIDNVEMLHHMGKPFSKLSLRERITYVLDNEPFDYWTTLSQSGIYVLLFQPDIEEEPMAGETFRLSRSILAACNETFPHSVSIGISSLLDSLLDLPRGIEEIRQCADYRMLLGEKSIVSYRAVAAMKEDLRDRKELTKRDLEQLLRRADGANISEFLSGAYKEIISTGLSKKQVQQFAMEMIQTAEELLKEFDPTFEQAEERFETRRKMLSYDILSDLIAFLDSYLKQVADVVSRSRAHAQDGVIDQVRQYIAQHYKDDITLHQLADQLYMNYFYLSKCIKKESGKNFRDLVLEYRIEMAKRLLRTSPMKSYEVAYAVGFKDPAYFSQWFKKVVGVSPTEFK